MKSLSIGALAAALAITASASPANAPPIANMLQSGQTAGIERWLNDLQRSFEAGTATEVDLRNAYRAFYELNDAQAEALRRWAGGSPTSYPAHLALGVYLKRAASTARGNRYIQDTPQPAIEKFQWLANQARQELVASFGLTKTPYLSVFHDMDVEGMAGQRGALDALARQADAMVPTNHLARDRYMGFLTPRWGGSYAEMERYLAAVRAQHLPEGIALRLEAIEDDDKAYSAREAGDTARALSLYKRALEKARRASPDAVGELLANGRDYVCARSPDPADCH